MAKTPKSKPVTDDAAKSVAAAAANAAAPAPQDAPAPLAELTADALQARADEWDAAREALKAAGEAAAAAQAALDALPKDATDEQRDDALRALADAENAVKTAQGVIEKLSLPEAFGIPGSSADAIVVPTEAGLAVSVADGGDKVLGEDVEPIFREVDALLDAFDLDGAKNRIEAELADVREGIARLEGYAGRLNAKLATIITPPDPPEADAGAGAPQRFRVTGPKAGRYRAGQFWGPEPVEVDLTYETWKALTADPAFTVEALDDGT